MFDAIDLFSGCGGLTVGLKRSGFRVVGAVELEKHSFATYKVNHPEVTAFLQDVRTIQGDSLLNLSKSKKIDLLAGCPPCQGFSSLTSKWRRQDPRNELVFEMGRLVAEILPDAIMMENVPGLAQAGKPIFEKFLRRLKRLGYVVNWGVLQVADFGIPQRRRRLVMVAGRGFSIPLPKPSHARVPTGDLLPWVRLRDVIYGMPSPMTLTESMALGGPQTVNWNVVRTLSSKNQQRLKHATAGKAWIKIPKRLRPACHQDRSSGFQNVYGRLSWDEPSATITGGCTTLSKGRFGHPDEQRTISVREAALVQTFPADYVFDSPYMDHVCDMIGNALPCDFSAVVASQCAVAIQAHRRGREAVVPTGPAVAKRKKTESLEAATNAKKAKA